MVKVRMKKLSIYNNKNKIIIPLIILIFLIFFPLLITKFEYFLHILIMIFIYAIAAEAWNVLGGFAGQVSLGNAMFFGIGAYTSSILLINFNLNPWIGLLLGGLLAVILAILIGFPVFRLRSHYFVIATLAAGEIITVIFLNFEYVNGAVGLELPIIQDSFKNLTFLYDKKGFYYIVLSILTILVILVYLSMKSKFGYYLRVIKEEEDAARSIGINTTAWKLVAISFSAFFTAIAGTLYAQYILYIDPNMVFPTILSVKFVLIAALGGSGTVLGPVIGAFILIPISEMTRIFLGASGQGIDVLLYGALIIIIGLLKPDGLITLFKSSGK